MRKRKSIVSPALVVGLLVLVGGLTVLYLVTQGNFGNADNRSQAARSCPDQCKWWLDTCNQRKTEQLKQQCLTTTYDVCLKRCEQKVGRQTAAPQQPSSGTSGSVAVGTCSRKFPFPVSCGSAPCAGSGNNQTSEASCREYADCCTWTATPQQPPPKPTSSAPKYTWKCGNAGYCYTTQTCCLTGCIDTKSLPNGKCPENK